MPPGWYRAAGDPTDTHRYWDGHHWVGDAEQIPPSEDSVGGRLAGGGRRVAARLIDVAINGVAYMVFLFALDGDVGDATPSVLASLASLLFTAIYEVGMVSRLGGTVGKLLLGLRIIEQRSGRTPPSMSTSLRRWLPNLVTILPTLGFLIGMLIIVMSVVWIFNDPRRRSVFDRTGETYVVRSP